MTPTDHAIAWWGDESYPKGDDWNALLRQFALCRNGTLDEVIAIVAERDLGDELRLRLESLKVRA